MPETNQPRPAPTLADVAQIVADVLMVEVTEEHAEAELVSELGAESIDFLDLLFRIEDFVGVRVPPKTWEEWVSARLPNPKHGTGITVGIVHEFVLDRVASKDGRSA